VKTFMLTSKESQELTYEYIDDRGVLIADLRQAWTLYCNIAFAQEVWRNMVPDDQFGHAEFFLIKFAKQV
jgi:hypothetical protein